MNRTAADLKAGDYLVRVEPVSPRSRVFERPVNARILSVAPHRDSAGFVTVVLEPEYPATASSLNLPLDRACEVLEEERRNPVRLGTDDAEEASYYADDEPECEGHESLRGDSMGATVYCDGSCVESWVSAGMNP